MQNRKCPNCQLVNWATAQQCARCAYPLTEEHAAADTYAPGDLAAQRAGAARFDEAPPPPGADSYGAQAYAPGEAGDGAAGASGHTFAPDDRPLVAPFTSAGVGLNQAWALYSRNFGLIAKLVLFAAVPFALGQSVMMHRLHERGSSTVVYALNVLIFSLVRWSLIPSAVIYAVTRKWGTGVASSVGECYQWAAGRWLRLLRVLVLSGLLTLLGTLLFIVPGMILSVAFALVVPVALFEPGGVEHVLRRSAELTKGVRWRLFGTILLLSLFVSIGGGMVSAVFVGAGVALGAGALVLGNTLSAIVSEVLSQLMVVLALTVYLGRLAPAGQAQAVATIAGPQSAPAPL
ncbi:MAG TPA: hypothetical protein VF546_09155 [Pyrinomonadaceae bacterium]|jgi:hypothetical protein